MKTTLIFLLLAFSLHSAADAQRRRAAAIEPAVELSFSCFFGNTREVLRNDYGGFHDQWEYSADYAVLFVRPAFFFVPWLAFEPELLWTAQSGTPPAHSLSANFAINIPIPGSPVIPFAVIGYGVGNAIPRLQRVEERTDKEPWNVRVTNAGAGVKFFVSPSAFMRLEYRFQMATNEQDGRYGEFAFKTQRTHYFNDLMIGAGIALY